MDELRGPTIQIVLHVKEGLGFGFLKSPFIVSGSLNGYVLETDPVVPAHAPVFDAELVWEADKRRFRNLRVQNVPVKVEVFTLATQGRKDKVGYLLLSLLAARPRPSNKVVEIKHTSHKLLGVKSEGKCCHPQLMLSLTVEDRTSTPTPRNELRIFHSNEVAYPTSARAKSPNFRSTLLTVNEYISESKKTVSSPALRPQLLCDEGLIQVGDGKDHFLLSFVIGTAENIDVLLPDSSETTNIGDCYITYSVFTHNIMTDRATCAPAEGARAHFNQRSSLRLRTSLAVLAAYFVECPLVVVKLCVGEKDVGICSMDLRKLIPTDNLHHFLDSFCNSDHSLTIHERCYMLPFEENNKGGNRRAFVDVEMSLKHCADNNNEKPPPVPMSARSATQLECSSKKEGKEPPVMLDCRSGSCIDIDTGVGGGYTNITSSNTTRYRNASGEASLQTNQIADMIKNMCDSFTLSQERLLNMNSRPTMTDMQVQCETETKETEKSNPTDDCDAKCDDKTDNIEPKATKTESSTQSDPIITTEKDLIKQAIPVPERGEMIKRYVEELEDWKEKQQELYKVQLQRKEQYHLDLLAKEWSKKRAELESKLRTGIEQCRHLAADMSRATEDFRLRGYRNTEREKKLLEAKKALEQHYTAKFVELREASQRMEEDTQRQLRVKDRRIDELELSNMGLEKQIDTLKDQLRKNEKEPSSKYSGLTKDQAASLIQELRCLEEKLSAAEQSKCFFKEQWGRAVRELHFLKLNNRKQALTQLKHDRKDCDGLDTIPDIDENNITRNPMDVKRLKDDFYEDIMANTPNLEAQSFISTTMSGPEGQELTEQMKELPKHPFNVKLNELMSERDELIKQDSPDEGKLQQLNHDIRCILLNFGT
ncbi:unnamed protein product [Plutella xylostella]|uniref:(diamondback moth) hypothetical protein n=1 Tax=Plutella xylostella TaxID=51655 RepID=A0A8S4EQU2_PLUXY|nr:unnamed protein product [Plutella xylostella]